MTKRKSLRTRTEEFEEVEFEEDIEEKEEKKFD